MSFINKIGRLFGYGEDVEDFRDESDGQDMTETGQTEDNKATAEGLFEVPTIPVVDAEMKSRIFEGVVEIFNKSLPDFLARSVDPAAQRRQLCEALDKSVDDYLNSLMATAEQYAEAKLKSAVDNSCREAEKLRSDMAQLEQQRAALRESQLSADRRRRALSDRVNDLEGKLATAEAEREQYELENKSLLNKLKVSDVQPEIVDELKHRIEELKGQLDAGRSGKQVEQTLQPDPETERHIAELEAANAVLTEAKAELEKKASAMEQDIAGLRQQQELSQGMYNDLQNKLAAEKNTVEELRAKLDEAKKLIDEFDKLQAQLGDIDTVIRKRDERIEKLKTTNRRLREDNESLRRRLEERDNTLFSSADQELSEPSPASEADKQLFSELSDLENDFECPDWFVADAGPGPVPLHPEDSSFGYQEPVRKPRRPESDAQLSLF